MNYKPQNIDENTLFEKIPQQQAEDNNNSQKKDIFSSQTKDKVEAAKSYIENKYSKLKREEVDKKEKWDMLNQKMENLNLNPIEKENIKKEILHKEAEQMRLKRKKLAAEDFDPITIIGRGAFGEVRLCKWKETKEVVVIKKMKKSEMIFKNQVTHIRAERDVLAAADNPWIVELKCSFQDDIYLYLVMEYLAGGDLMTLLMKKDILSEDEAKFYIAEAIIAVDSVHKLNYIHRDLKPDNILIDRSGHIKLTDFGLCKHTEIRPKKLEVLKKEDKEKEKPGLQLEIGKKPGYRRNRQMAYSTVGTPDYIAPEVFAQNGYTETVDWWSLGTILYEMLVGYPPFFSDDPSLTCQKILHWRKTFTIPMEANLSPAAYDLLRRLITDANERLGINGVEEIKAHPFFVGIDWKKIRDKKSANIPDLKNETDTSNFDKFEEEDPWIPDVSQIKKGRKDVFIGYTFNRNIENQRSSLVSALIDLESTKNSSIRANDNHHIDSKEEEKNNEESLQKTVSMATLEKKKSFNQESSQASSFLKKNLEKPLFNPNQKSPQHLINSVKPPASANPGLNNFKLPNNDRYTSNSNETKEKLISLNERLSNLNQNKKMGDPGNSPNNDNKTPNSFLNQLKKNSNEPVNNPIQNFGSHLKSNILPNSKNFKLGEFKNDIPSFQKNFRDLNLKSNK